MVRYIRYIEGRYILEVINMLGKGLNTEIKLTRKKIDWKKTGRNLQLLRNDNINLRRTVCQQLNFHKGNCSGMCATCKYDMETAISRTELARIFYVSESVIFNWESGKTPVSLEDIIFYCELAGVTMDDIIVFD